MDEERLFAGRADAIRLKKGTQQGIVYWYKSGPDKKGDIRFVGVAPTKLPAGLFRDPSKNPRRHFCQSRLPGGASCRWPDKNPGKSFGIHPEFGVARFVGDVS